MEKEKWASTKGKRICIYGPLANQASSVAAPGSDSIAPSACNGSGRFQGRGLGLTFPFLPFIPGLPVGPNTAPPRPPRRSTSHKTAHGPTILNRSLKFQKFFGPPPTFKSLENPLNFKLALRLLSICIFKLMLYIYDLDPELFCNLCCDEHYYLYHPVYAQMSFKCYNYNSNYSFL
jgi:hypothetical protein